MSLQKCYGIALMALLMSSSVCSASRPQASTTPEGLEGRIPQKPDPKSYDKIEDSKYSNRGGWGNGGGWSNSGYPYGQYRPRPITSPRPSPVSDDEALYCQPITCSNPYTCPGFTLYLNRLAMSSYQSRADVRVGRHQHDRVADVEAPEPGQ